MAMPEHLKTGARGEQLAARYLRDHGYIIYAGGFSTPLGETDIIAQDKDGTFCFVEVKTRAPGGMLPPAEAVDTEKQKRLLNNAAAFIKHERITDADIRFDIIEVILHDLIKHDVNHIKNAFGQGEVFAPKSGNSEAKR